MAKKGEFKSNAKPNSIRQREWNSTEIQKKRRAMRNAARARLMAKGKVSKGDGVDVNHKKPLSSGGSNSDSNLNLKEARKNRIEGAKIKARRAKK